MNILMLKTIAYNPIDKVFYSPSMSKFAWRSGIVAKECHRCTIDLCNPDCTCGIYGSPNPEALDEYATYVNSIFVLMDTYGWMDIWTAPDDVPYSYAVRVWGSQIKGVIGDDFLTGTPLSRERGISSMRACEEFNVKALPWRMARKMIQVTWAKNCKLVHDPYDHEEWKKW